MFVLAMLFELIKLWTTEIKSVAETFLLKIAHISYLVFIPTRLRYTL